MGNKPTVGTLNVWVADMFIPRGREMDLEVQHSLNEALIQTKVEMLTRHIETGKRMQTLSLDYLEAHKEELTASAAVRLLVEGLRVERESAGIPGALAKLTEKSDEELMKELEAYIQDSPVEYDFDIED